MLIQQQPKPDWSSVPRPGVQGVDFRILLRADGILIANLRFSTEATIDQHAAPHEIDVICLSGSGFTSIGEKTYPICAGQTVRWPASIDHCLWTEQDALEAIVVERYGA